MADHILMREDAPFTDEQWRVVDQTVSEVADRVMVGRRILDLYGPLGFGAYTVPLYTYGGEDAVRAKIVRQLSMSTLMHDFVITVKDLELINAGQPFDKAPVAAAATRAARAEDALIFNGNKGDASSSVDDASSSVDEDADGLLTVEGRSVRELSDWDMEGAALQDIAVTTAHLVSEGFYGPYFVVLHPVRYTKLQRVYGKRGILEVELIEKQAKGGVFATPVMPEDKVLVVAGQSQYMDLAVGLDLSVAFVETVNLEHCFRLMETLALRIKQPQAICTLE